MQWIGRFGREALSWLYPDRCELCYRIGRPPLCDECRSEMQPLDNAVHAYFAGNPLNLSASLYAFEGRAAEAVKRLKYSRATGLGRPMSDILLASLDSLSLPEFHVYVPVPIHWRRNNTRGFNQSELLCESFPQDKVVPGLLKRVRSTRPQVGLTREQRLRNLKGAFEAAPSVNGLKVLLIDDVTTTGGTAIACAEALQEAGAAYVGILTFCGE